MSSDCFALLELPRQPWLDEEVTRAQFQRLAGAAHPDGAAGDNARFVALNQAWQTLRSPTTRLRHYLELEHPELLPSATSTATLNGELFMEIAEAQQRAQAITTRLADAKSPLTRAMLEPERVAARERLEELTAKVASESEALHQRLQLDAQPPGALAEILGQLVFLEKWSHQLRERLLALA